MAFTKCNCVHCSGHIEFDEAEAGAIVTCPHCGLETQLFIPNVSKVVPNKKATPAQTKAPPVWATQMEHFKRSVQPFAWICAGFFAVTTIIFASLYFAEKDALKKSLAALPRERPRPALERSATPTTHKIDPKSQLTLLDAKIGYGFASGKLVVLGRLQNCSSVRFRSVRIIFNLMEGSHQTGQAIAITYNLPAGQTWEFATDNVGQFSKISGEPLIEGEVAE